jgi:hypothetical protein
MLLMRVRLDSNELIRSDVANWPRSMPKPDCPSQPCHFCLFDESCGRISDASSEVMLVGDSLSRKTAEQSGGLFSTAGTSSEVIASQCR